MEQLVLFASIRSVFIWVGVIILLNRKQKWSTLVVYAVITLIFTYFSILLLDQLARPVLFAFTFLLTSWRKKGWVPEAKLNFFYLSIIFMIMIWAHAIANAVAEIIYEANDGYLFRGRYYIGAESAPVFGFHINMIVAIVCFWIVRKALNRTKILRFIEQIDSEYVETLVLGIGFVLFAYYAVILIPEIIGFECSGKIYLEAIYTTVLVFMTGGLLVLFSSIVNKEMALIRNNASLVQVNEQLVQRGEEVVQKDEAILEKDEVIAQRNEVIAQADDKLMQRESLIGVLDTKIMNIDDVQNKIRDFNHGQRELITILLGAVETGDKRALYKLIEEYDVKVNDVMGDLVLFPDLKSLSSPEMMSVRCLLNSKASEAMRESINFNVEISSEITNIGIPILEFIDILSIWVNNAMEEAVHTDEKNVHISFILNNDTLEVRVSNSCRENVLNPNLIEDKDFTTKGSGHGNGLRIINEKMMKHDNIYVSTEVSNGEFMQLLEIVFDEEESI